MLIREAHKEDAEEKGLVHYQSWIETYTGLMDPAFLSRRSLERCVDMAREHPENTIVAETDGQIVGFACYSETRDTDMSDTGEIQALYVLKKYQKQGIGAALLKRCEQILKRHSKIMLYVLAENKNAIGFYEHNGFRLDGVTKDPEVMPGITLHEMRMVKERARDKQEE
ncbi:MAG TPA: GNAT family N-acetyltransferase [Bacillota bacterium]|nr:GNAT family N-acetyltransferase [Bacillota bacterium]